MAVNPPSPEASLPAEIDAYEHVPVDLLTQKRMFPHPTIDHLGDLAARGWARLGVGTAVLNERGEMLILSHRENDKLSDGAEGPVTETMQVRTSDQTVETTEQTIFRSFQEELDVEDPRVLEPRARIFGGWTLSHWPAGDKKLDEALLGINPVVVVPNSVADHIRRFIGNPEIKTAAFRPVEAILDLPKLRPGVSEWIGGLSAKGLLDGAPNHLLHRPHWGEPTKDQPGWQDVVFADLDL